MRRSNVFWMAPLLAALLAGCQESADSDAAPTGASAAEEADSLGNPSPQGELTALSTTDADSPREPVELMPIAPDDLQRLVAENSGKVVLFDFWATWCSPCLQQYPHTVELSEKHAGDLVVYSVSMDEIDDETVARVKEQLAKWPAGRVHTHMKTEEALDAAMTGFEISDGALPHYKVFGRDGTLVATLGGIENPPTPETVDAAIAEALMSE